MDNHHRPFLVHKHDRRSIVLYTNMAAVTSCENDLPPFFPVVPRTPELPRLQLSPFLSIFVKLTSIEFVTVFNAILTSRQGNSGAVTKLHTNLLKAIHPTSNSQRFLWLRRTWGIKLYALAFIEGKYLFWLCGKNYLPISAKVFHIWSTLAVSVN